MKRLAFAAALVVACLVSFAVFAQTTAQTAVATVCADNGALLLKIVAAVASVMASAGLLSNFKNKLPPKAAAVLQFLAGQAVHGLELWAKSSAVLLLALSLGLAACTAAQQQQLQQDNQVILNDLTQALPVLKAAGCDVSALGTAAGPLVQIAVDAKGQQIYQIVDSVGTILCSAPIPPAPATAPAVAPAPAPAS